MDERPQMSAVRAMLDELKGAMANMGETQRKMLEVTGTGWSPDRMIKAVVGPRGQLVELEIDPRVYRTPNSKALAASILSTVRAAVDDATEKTKEIMDATLPMEGGTAMIGNANLVDVMRSHDADLGKVLEGGDSGKLH
ncbi:YbaB/EbfC family nucleoid-associated protein [Plantactinospora sp. GCM10030261]|uniref:YbaB/EbfC family nucleoid-associated protein n=1 Tax=Plantactinospora sp. GCM10030261 TaxID=3273420 RepID=UPI00361E543D